MENKRKLAGNIVRARYVLMMVLLLAAGFSAAMIGRTNINYDLTRYLADDTMTKRALVVMNEEFGVSEQLRVMFADLSEAQLREALETLDEMEEIRLASHDPVSDVRVKDGKTWQLVTLTLGECNVSRLVRKLRGLFPDFGEYMVGGSAAAQIDLQESVAVEIPAVMAIAVAIVILVLLLTSHAWLEPVVILFVLAVSIVINMGTNFVFPDVSFVTFAVSAILQLALSIDYAIMLLHTYNAFCDQGMGPEEAMTEALAQCFMRIASSAMTTVAGLLSLLFMSFTIGFDIGMVLSKGIVISMLCVFLLMPGAALLLKKPLMATRHRPIRLGGEHLGRWIWRMRWPIAIVLTAAVAGGAYLNARNTFSFTDPGATDGTENSRISEVFGASNPLVLMVPSEGKDSDYDRQRALVSDLEALKGADGAPLVSGIASMVTTGAAALEYYTVDDVAQMTGQSRLRITLFFFLNGFGQRARADRLLAVAGGLFGDNPDLAGMKAMLETAQGAFTGPHYARLLVEPAFESRAEDFTDNIEAVLSAVRASYGDTFYVTGSP
ncbi:MAG: MMPL family transporter, partial [Lachnospiraceae bacterium]|nr:MMPL family transporter [Lachnospiraceae bacterium]